MDTEFKMLNVILGYHKDQSIRQNQSDDIEDWTRHKHKAQAAREIINLLGHEAFTDEQQERLLATLKEKIELIQEGMFFENMLVNK